MSPIDLKNNIERAKAGMNMFYEQKLGYLKDIDILNKKIRGCEDEINRLQGCCLAYEGLFQVFGRVLPESPNGDCIPEGNIKQYTEVYDPATARPETPIVHVEEAQAHALREERRLKKMEEHNYGCEHRESSDPNVSTGTEGPKNTNEHHGNHSDEHHHSNESSVKYHGNQLDRPLDSMSHGMHPESGKFVEDRNLPHPREGTAEHLSLEELYKKYRAM